VTLLATSAVQAGVTTVLICILYINYIYRTVLLELTLRGACKQYKYSEQATRCTAEERPYDSRQVHFLRSVQARCGTQLTLLSNVYRQLFRRDKVVEA